MAFTIGNRDISGSPKQPGREWAHPPHPRRIANPARLAGPKANPGKGGRAQRPISGPTLAKRPKMR
jgi:hypothetical protein